MPRRFAVLFAFLVLVIALLSATVWFLLDERSGARPGAGDGTTGPAPPPPDPEAVFEPARFADLPGWADDPLTAALPALRASCSVLARRPADAPVGPEGVGGQAGDWRRLCATLEGESAPTSADALRPILERELRAWAVTNRGVERDGLLTGYYEPRLHGSRRRHGPFQTPLYREPGDLVAVDLGAFRGDLAGRRIAGRLVQGRGGDRLVPYHDRREIEQGALAGRDLELIWVDDPVDAFFLQVQGSGRVVLEDGTMLRVGYAGQNGHPYTAIGRELVERGEMTLEEVSLRSIRRWLEAHPEAAPEVMAVNASYVFFRILGEVAETEGAPSGPLGSLGVALTPGRSLAVDDRFLPLGAPIWVAGRMPRISDPAERSAARGGEPTLGVQPLRRLMVAQDTGGAIRGPVRGDVFWGAGEEARAVAGHMKHRGALWVLLPRGVDPSAP